MEVQDIALLIAILSFLLSLYYWFEKIKDRIASIKFTITDFRRCDRPINGMYIYGVVLTFINISDKPISFKLLEVSIPNDDLYGYVEREKNEENIVNICRWASDKAATNWDDLLVGNIPSSVRLEAGKHGLFKICFISDQIEIEKAITIKYTLWRKRIHKIIDFDPQDHPICSYSDSGEKDMLKQKIKNDIILLWKRIKGLIHKFISQ